MPLVSISTATIIDVNDAWGGAGFNMCNPRYCTFEEATLPPLVVVSGAASKSTTSLFGSQSLQLTANAPDCYAYLGATATDYNVNITPNKKWIASFYVYSTVARGAGSVELYIRTSDGVQYNINGGAIAANEWTRISGVINLSANASTKAIYRLHNNTAETTVLYDGVMLEAQIGSLETPSVFNEPPNFLNTYTGALDANNTSVDINGTIQGVSSGTGTAVSNSLIKVGGNNLMYNSGQFDSLDGWRTNGSTVTLDYATLYAGYPTMKLVGHGGVNHLEVMRLKADTEYTVSALVKGSAAIANGYDNTLHIQNWTDETGETYSNLHQETARAFDTAVTTSWKTVYQTFRTVASTSATYCRFYFHPIGEGLTLNVAQLKLEEGNKYSGWTPSIKETQNSNISFNANMLKSVDTWILEAPASVESNVYAANRQALVIDPLGVVNSTQLDLESSVDYTISFEAWSTVSGTTINLDLFPDDLPQYSVTLTTTPTLYTYIFNSASASMSNCRVRFFYPSNTVRICDVKLELGGKRTPWVAHISDQKWANITGEGKAADNATRNVYKGAWASGSAYAVGDLVIDSSNNGWTCLVAILASTTSAQAITSPSATAIATIVYWGVYTVKGDKGNPGAAGDSVDIIFKRGIDATTAPTIASHSTLAAAVTAGWSSSVPSAGVFPLWSSKGLSAASGGSYNWQAPVKIEGANVAEVTIYARASTAPAVPTNTTGATYTFGTANPLAITGTVWSGNVPSGTLPVYTSRAVVSAAAGYTSPVGITGWATPVISLQNGTNAITGGLTNPSQSVPTASDGKGAVYTTTSGVFEVYSGTTNITTLCTFSTSAATNGLTLAIVAGTGEYYLSGTDWISDIETFTLTATLPALYGSGAVTKKYTISKSKAGATGITSDLIPIFYQNGINGATVAVPTGVPSGGSYIFSTNVLSSLPTGWSRTCPAASTTATYSVECRFSTTTPSLSIDATWTNLRLHTQTGTNGTSVYSASVYYQRGINGAIADTPGTPDGGSYNFSTATLTAPTGFWSISQPTTTTVPTWASDYTFNTTAGGTITAGTWSAPKVIAQKGESPAIFWWEDTIPIYYRNGDNGATVAVPTAPSGGSYNFVTKTFVSPDTKWTTTRPSTITTNATYVSDYRFRTDTAGITVVATQWNNLAVCALKTTETGTSLYKATVYRLAGTAPPYPTGGTYNFSTNLLTAPDLWSTTQPLITEPNLFVYAVDFNFNAGSTTTQTATTWSNLRIDAQMGSAGSNGISASLTNDSFSLPLDTNGSISYVGSGTKLSLYDGATKLIYDGVGTDAGKWKVVATGSNITASPSISGSGTTEASIGDASGFLGTTTASIDFEFTGRNAAGFPIKASKSQTFTKQQAGKEGPSVTVTASSALAFTSTSGTLNTKSGSVNPDITLTANTKNMTGAQTYAWDLTKTTGSIETTSTLSTASTQSITAATFGTAISAKVTCTVTYNSQTYKVDSYIYRNEKMNASTSGAADPLPRTGATGTANPANPIKGDSYFNTTTNLLWVWTGSVWNKVMPLLSSGNISTFFDNAAIGNAQIGTAAVETANIKDGNITAAKIGSLNLTGLSAFVSPPINSIIMDSTGMRVIDDNGIVRVQIGLLS